MLWLLLRQIWWWWWWWGDSLVETWEVFGGEWGVDFLGVVNLSRYWVPFVSRRIHNVMRRNFLQAKKKKLSFYEPTLSMEWAKYGLIFASSFFPFFFFEEQKKNSSNYAFHPPSCATDRMSMSILPLHWNIVINFLYSLF